MVENRELGRQRIEEITVGLRPKVSKFEWIENVETDTYLLLMTGGFSLRIAQSAVDQAADEPSALGRLKVEIERALRESESGSAVGFVLEV